MASTTEAAATRDPNRTGAGQSFDQLLAAWPPRPRVAAAQMSAKYGPPDEITAEKLVWRDKTPFLRITVTRKEDPHDFPRPHMDFLEHTIAYRVPPDRASQLTAFDGSATFDRTKGELSARCDLEGHNILTLNIAHELLTGKRDVEDARRTFAEIVVLDALGAQPAPVAGLQFDVEREPQGDADQPVIPGSPVRMTGAEASRTRDAGARNAGAIDPATILGLIVAIDDNEILAAMDATKKRIPADVRAYAQMLHKQHGKNLKDTFDLAREAGTAPAESAAVEAQRIEGAEQLAKLAPLDGNEYARAYVAAMISGHEKAIALIDNRLLPAATDETLRRHLTETRGHVAMHLEEARRLQTSVPQGM